MHGVDEAVTLRDSEDCPLETNLVDRIDDPGFEAHLRDVFHEHLTDFVESLLSIGEESSAVVLLGPPDDGHVLTVEVDLLFEVLHSLIEVVVVSRDIIDLLLEVVQHRNRIFAGLSRLLLPDLVKLNEILLPTLSPSYQFSF